MSVEQHQTPLSNVEKPSREIPKRRVLKYLAATGTLLGLELQYRFLGRYLESFPQGSLQRRIGLTDRFTRKAILDQFAGEEDTRLAEAWWKFNIAQVSAENEGKALMAAGLFAYMFGNGAIIDISQGYQSILTQDPMLKDSSTSDLFANYVQQQLNESDTKVVTQLDRNATGIITPGGNIHITVPAQTIWYPQLQEQLKQHFLFIAGKIQNASIYLAQPPPATGPPTTEETLSLLTSDAKVLLFKQFTAESAVGYEVNQQSISNATSQLLRLLPFTINQDYITKQPWYKEILNSGFILTRQDAQLLKDSGNAKDFEMWGSLPQLHDSLSINIPLSTIK